MLQRADAELVGAGAWPSWPTLAGLRRAPVDAHVSRAGAAALPQYAVGHLDRVARIRAARAPACPAWRSAGPRYDGVGIPACIGSGVTPRPTGCVEHAAESQRQ